MTSAHGTLGWLTDFPVPPHPSGAVIAVTFGWSGVWMARIDGGGRVLADLHESRITPQVLDVRIATELVENGKIPDAADDVDLFDELVALSTRARESIGDRDSALAMGRGTLTFLSVTRLEMVEATVPEVNRLHGMLIELAGSDPVDAILLGPGVDLWPGLWEAFTERGFSALLPGDPFPVTFGGDENPTGLLDRVDEAPSALAWTEQPDDSGPLSFSASGIDPSHYALDANGDVRFDAPIPGVDDGQTDEDRELQARRRRRWTAAAAVVVLLGLAGGGVALALNTQEHSGPDMSSVDGPRLLDEPSASTTVLEHIPNSADPAEVAAARATMLSYTTPPPPPPKPKSTAKPSTGRTPGPGPTRRTRPNPIPGLPPIVIR